MHHVSTHHVLLGAADLSMQVHSRTTTPHFNPTTFPASPTQSPKTSAHHGCTNHAKQPALFKRKRDSDDTEEPEEAKADVTARISSMKRFTAASSSLKSWTPHPAPELEAYDTNKKRKKYSYTPIEPNSDSFRLLKISSTHVPLLIQTTN